jgi:hypothetical protein
MMNNELVCERQVTKVITEYVGESSFDGSEGVIQCKDHRYVKDTFVYCTEYICTCYDVLYLIHCRHSVNLD